MTNMSTFSKKSQTEIRYHNLALSKLDHVLDFMARTEQLVYTTNNTPTENRVMKFVWVTKDEMRYTMYNKSTQRIVVEGRLQI